jgi:hypothetical protein
VSDREKRALARFGRVALLALVVTVLGELQRLGPGGLSQIDWRVVGYAVATAVLAAAEKYLRWYSDEAPDDQQATTS